MGETDPNGNHATSKVDGGHVNIGFEGLDDPGIIPPKVKAEDGAADAAVVDEDDGPEREQWGNPLEFLMSCISLSVGLGNIWRFPYTAYKNGGGAFLIPYLVVLTFIGRPVYFLEIALGQFSSYGPVKVWGMSPFFTGVGYGSVIGTTCVLSYYAMLMGLTIFYLFSSFQKTLPWAECDEKWINLGSGIIDQPDTVHCPLEDTFMCNSSFPGSIFELDGTPSNVSVSQLFFENEVLKQKYQIDDGLGNPDWRLALCLLLAWILIWGSLVRGVQSSGKIAYFTALFPYVVLFIMFIRGVTLPNAGKGIEYLLTPVWEKMLEPQVWFEAIGQCFFSLNTGFGPLVMFGSYNGFKQNSYRDAWIVSGLDTFTSLFAGITVFAVLGNLAGELGVEIQDVARGGAGLTFVSFAQGLGTFEVVPQLFSVLFYVMLLTLGVGSGVSLCGTVIAVIHDNKPKWSRPWIVTGVCIGGFLLGLMYTTPGGQFMSDLVDYFGANFVIYLMVMLEAIGVSWVYGINNIIDDFEFMLNRKLGWYWKICWAFVVPVGLGFILAYSLATSERITYNDLRYPDGVIVFGWMIAASAFAIIPFYAVKAIRKAKGGNLKEKIKASLQSTADWGPQRSQLRKEWLAYKLQKQSQN